MGKRGACGGFRNLEGAFAEIARGVGYGLWGEPLLARALGDLVDRGCPLGRGVAKAPAQIAGRGLGDAGFNPCNRKRSTSPEGTGWR